ncbi:MAG: 1-phosphofructokinase family hexose kinase [Clostridiales bacterium]|nr:1-phosphofructokinase family hexose kinase [Clostridiales bacterium]
MITTVCLNPAIDKTATLPYLEPGEVNRLEDVRYDIGGKGLNVAKTLCRLGIEASCVGCLGEEDERAFMAMLKHEGLVFSHIPLNGNVRCNLKILDQKSRQVTEFNESGPIMDSQQLEAFLLLLKKEAQGSAYVTLSGSLPVGCSQDVYQRCMHTLPNHTIILDATGEALLLGLKEKPFLIKPNLKEMEAVVQQKLRTLRAIRDAALSLIAKGAQHVLVSMGPYGALLTNGIRTTFSPALQVNAISTVGAGDAMLAGILMGLHQKENVFDAFCYGIAAGAASVMTEGTQPLVLEDFQTLLPKVTLQEV